MDNKEKTAAKIEIEKLVNRFETHYDEYMSKDYKEARTRKDFIDPFFKALGWDMDNENGYSEFYRDVIQEPTQIIEEDGLEKAKAPDYAFRIGNGTVFFVESKKPSVVIKDDVSPAYQIRRYGWNAGLPISIVTDFEEFAIYDCTKKPNKSDKPTVARLKYFTFMDYVLEFDFLWDTFSRENVKKGGFHKFAKSDASKKGTTSVDNDFLLSLDNWRTQLASSISLRNKDLDEDEINFAVQQTIDRIIFLRITEDRGIEKYGQLKKCLSGENYYQNLFSVFVKADAKYNSGLFDLKKDKVCKTLVVDNKVVKSIINDLYYPQCPYEFKIMPIEILGSAYEQFLGKVIRITPAHHAKIEEKPEVRKAGGVFYTPKYIVDYIVKNTVGKLISGKTPKDIDKIKIVDPACGSGSFLIGAYQFLLDFHKEYYQKHEVGKKQGKESPLTRDGNLTVNEKRKILINNIFGIDLDVNAVEVTKLSLLLKCLENETENSVNHQLTVFNERLLPTLENNIKSGNSLVDTDFYDWQLDFGEERKIKPFNWQKGFPDVFKQGGFDAVIGNPPYVMLQNVETRDVFDYCLSKYKSAKYKIDTYQLFIEKSIELLRADGLLGFITPNTYLKNIHSEPLRKLILDNTVIIEILLFTYPVFMSASVDTCVSFLKRGIACENDFLTANMSNVQNEVMLVSSINQFSIFKNNRLDFNLFVSKDDSNILDKISIKSKPLGFYCNAYFGIQTYDRKEFVSDKKLNKTYVPVIDGWNIEPFNLKPSIEYVCFTPSAIKSGGNHGVYKKDRICIRQIGNYPIATFVRANLFTLNTIYNVFVKDGQTVSLLYLLGVINSSVTRFFWKRFNSDEKKTFPKIKKEAILSIPIPVIEDNSKSEISDLVEQLLTLNNEKQLEKLQSKIDQMQNRIDYYEQKINEIVYKIYGLTNDEIKIVESV